MVTSFDELWSSAALSNTIVQKELLGYRQNFTTQKLDSSSLLNPIMGFLELQEHGYYFGGIVFKALVARSSRALILVTPEPSMNATSYPVLTS